jgi:hypothetical protein
MVLGAEKGVQVHFKKDVVEITSGGLPTSVGGFVALGALVSAQLSRAATAINGHIHQDSLGAPTTPPTITPNVIPYVPSPVDSKNLKAD